MLIIYLTQNKQSCTTEHALAMTVSANIVGGSSDEAA